MAMDRMDRWCPPDRGGYHPGGVMAGTMVPRQVTPVSPVRRPCGSP
jgi:hypothetical protein